MYNNQNDYLSHYGVRGMKKGIRRWTNEDGSLTEEGKRHYGIGAVAISAYKGYHEKDEILNRRNNKQ